MSMNMVCSLCGKDLTEAGRILGEEAVLRIHANAHVRDDHVKVLKEISTTCQRPSHPSWRGSFLACLVVAFISSTERKANGESV